MLTFDLTKHMRFRRYNVSFTYSCVTRPRRLFNVTGRDNVVRYLRVPEVAFSGGRVRQARRVVCSGLVPDAAKNLKLEALRSQLLQLKVLPLERKVRSQRSVNDHN